MSLSKKMRLDKLLANMGAGSRSDVKKLIKQGKVSVDGTIVKDSGLIIDPQAADVSCNGERIVFRDTIYIMLNKPQDVISATEDTRDRTVIDLLSSEDRLLNPFPVGRLDKDTEGLLLITNDGKLAHELLSPRKHVAKTYEATVRGYVDEADVQQFAAGVTLNDGYVTMPAELLILERTTEAERLATSDTEDKEEAEDTEAGAVAVSRIRLTIHEGKFHQVKRMFEAVGKKVTYLRRISMGPLVLDLSLPLGSYRPLTEKELEQLLIIRDNSSSTDQKA